jgi:putative membrane protein
MSCLNGALPWPAVLPLTPSWETQGDPWDTQEDMATAVAGALTALLFFSRWHDRLIGRMENDKAVTQATG